MSPPRVRAGLAMLAAAMRAKAGEITQEQVIALVDTVAAECPLDLRSRAAARAFAHRVLLRANSDEDNVRFAGQELHDFLIEDGERMAAE